MLAHYYMYTIYSSVGSFPARVSYTALSCFRQNNILDSFTTCPYFGSCDHFQKIQAHIYNGKNRLCFHRWRSHDNCLSGELNIHQGLRNNKITGDDHGRQSQKNLLILFVSACIKGKDFCSASISYL